MGRERLEYVRRRGLADSRRLIEWADGQKESRKRVSSPIGHSSGKRIEDGGCASIH
jgi:hypothetical protein